MKLVQWYNFSIFIKYVERLHCLSSCKRSLQNLQTIEIALLSEKSASSLKFFRRFDIGRGLREADQARSSSLLFDGHGGALRECEAALDLEDIQHEELRKIQDQLGAILFKLSGLSKGKVTN